MSSDNPRCAGRWIMVTVALGLIILALGSFALLTKKPAAPPRDIASRQAPVPSSPEFSTTQEIEPSASAAPASQPFVPGDAYVPPVTPSASTPGTVAEIPATAAPAHVDFVAGGKLLVTGTDGRLEFCDVVTGQRQPVGVTPSGVRAMGASPDGRMIASFDAAGTVNLIETTAYGRTNTLAPGIGGVNGIALSPDGRVVALAGSGVVVWDIAGKKPRTKLLANEPCTAVAFSPDGHVLAIATAAGVSLWDTTFWQKQATLSGGGATVVKCWPARAALVAAGAGGVIRVYDLSARQLQTTLGGGGEVADLAPSPDGRVIVTCGVAGVTVWDSTARAARKLP
jgi:WD40 repeat protein